MNIYVIIQTHLVSQKIGEFKRFVVPCGKFGSPYPGKAQRPQEQCYIPIAISVCSVFLCQNNGMSISVCSIFLCPNNGMSASVCSIFLCPNNGVAASVWDFKSVCRCKLHVGAVGMML